MEASEESPQQRHIRAWAAAGDVHPAQVVLRLDGPLDRDRLDAALSAVADRHGLTRAADASGRGVLDTAVEATGPGRHRLTLALPALLADGRSLDLLAGDTADAYAAAVTGGPALPEALPYAEFAAWQNALRDDEEASGPRDFGRLRELRRTQRLPWEADGPAGPLARAAAVLRPEESAAVEAAADALGATAADFLHACWTVLLWRHARTPEIVTGTVADCRVYEELAPLVGACAKVLPVVGPVAEGDVFADVLERLRKAAAVVREELEFFAWPPDDAAEPAHPVWGFEHRAAPGPRTAAGVTFAEESRAVWSGPFTLLLRCEAGAGGLRLVLEHRTGRVDAGYAACLLQQFRSLAAHAAAAPRTAVGRLRADDGGEGPAAAGREGAWQAPRWCAHEQVAARAAEAPGRIAVTAGGSSLTYGELDAAANRLARYLAALGAGPESLVGVCLERGLDMVVALLAVHRAGAAYVPVDPHYPAGHIAAILGGARLTVLLTDASAPRGVAPAGLPAVRLDLERDAIGAHSAEPPGTVSHPDQLAYVLHTSGSTGAPKGVQISQGAFAAFLRAMSGTPGIGADDSLVAVTTLSFDIAGLELWLPLVAGARVTVAGRAEAADPRALAALLDSSAATVLQATPVTWRMLLAAGWPGSPRLTALVGGEALPPALAAGLRPRVGRMWNMYGPTETTVWSACAEIDAAEPARVTVGHPVDGTCAHVLDDRMRPVPVGMVGELCLGGLGVARGYLDRPGLTAERFVPDPFGCLPGGRVYRTGDLARRDPRGRLHVLGRADSQVKVRGFRIELGAVEAALARHPAVRLAVAVTAPEASGDLRLDAHVVPVEGAAVDPAALSAFLRETVPPAMVPSRIGILAELPLTANGKVDRAALPEVAAASAPPGPRTGAVSALERTIVGVLADALGVAEVGAADNFFELGGHSVLLVEVAARLTEELGREVGTLALLEHPTVAALAAHLGAAERRDAGREPPEAAADERDGGGRGDRAAGRDRLRRRRTMVEEH